jgi:hypothetical protein
VKKKIFGTITINNKNKQELRWIAKQERRSMAQQIYYWISRYKQENLIYISVS